MIERPTEPPSPQRRLHRLVAHVLRTPPAAAATAATAAAASAQHQHQLFVNPRWAARAASPPPAVSAAVSLADVSAALSEVASWRGYAPTPLIPLPASLAGVGQLLCKHEGYRFDPVGSFKPCGVVYALAHVLVAELRRRQQQWRRQRPKDLGGGGASSAAQQLLAARQQDPGCLLDVTVCAATSGNHGRALAWGARLFGCRCVIYMGEGVSAARQAAIEALGASVVRVGGAYDDVVAQSEADAAQHGYFVISNVKYPGVDVPRLIMHGYAVTGDEIATQLVARQEPPPSHVFICGGGGRFGAGVAAALWQRYGAQRPRCVLVEPAASAALQASARAGRAVAVEPGASLMDGLVVESANQIGFPVLCEAAFGFLSVDDSAAASAMRLLARHGCVVGETGVAGWAGLLTSAADPAMRQALGMDSDSRVVVVATEGATDPELYRLRAISIILINALL